MRPRRRELVPRPTLLDLRRDPAPSERPFDPEHDLPDTALERYRNEMQVTAVLKDPSDYLVLRSLQPVLFPRERLPEMPHQLAESTQSKCQRELQPTEQPDSQVNGLYTLCTLFLAEPEKRDQLPITDHLWQMMSELVRTTLDAGQEPSRAFGMRLTLVFPGKARALFAENPKHWEEYKEQWEQEVHQQEPNGQSLEFLARARIVFPDHYNELAPQADTLEQYRDILDELYEQNHSKYFLCAYYLSIVAADEIQLTEERGLELINHSSAVLADPLPARPH